jgi:transcriptional regulator with XRE-family HTH domain
MKLDERRSQRVLALFAHAAQELGSQTAAAAATGMSTSYLSKIARGDQRPAVREDTARRVLAVCGLPWSWLDSDEPVDRVRVELPASKPQQPTAPGQSAMTAAIVAAEALSTTERRALRAWLEAMEGSA